MEQNLVFDLAALPQGESRHERRIPPGAFGLEIPGVRIDGLLEIRLDLYRSGDSIRVQGDIRGRTRFDCTRCLGPGGQEIAVRLDAYCEKREGELEDEDRQALEEGGLVFHDGKELDLFEEIRQTIVLEIPWNPVCRPDCRGLCPRCGHDLNAGSCSCRGESKDPRWSPFEGRLDS